MGCLAFLNRLIVQRVKRVLPKLPLLLLVSIISFGIYYSYDTPGALAISLGRPPHNVTSEQLGLLYMAYSAPNIPLALFGGLIIDKVGDRISLIGTSTASVLGTVIIALGATFASFALMFVGRFVFGLSAELMLATQATIVGRCLPEDWTAFGLGFVLTMSYLGTVAVLNTLPGLAVRLSTHMATWVAVGVTSSSFVLAVVFVIVDLVRVSCVRRSAAKKAKKVVPAAGMASEMTAVQTPITVTPCPESEATAIATTATATATATTTELAAETAPMASAEGAEMVLADADEPVEVQAPAPSPTESSRLLATPPPSENAPQIAVNPDTPVPPLASPQSPASPDPFAASQIPVGFQLDVPQTSRVDTARSTGSGAEGKVVEIKAMQALAEIKPCKGEEQDAEAKEQAPACEEDETLKTGGVGFRWRAFRHFPGVFWFLGPMGMILVGINFTFTAFATDLVHKYYGYDDVAAGSVASLTSITAMIAAPILGLLIDMVGLRCLWMLLDLLLFVFSFVMLNTRAMPPHFPLICIGFVMGSLPCLCNGSVVRVLPKERMGTGLAIMAVHVNLGLTVLPYVAGAITTATGGYVTTVWIWMGVACAGVLLAVFLFIFDLKHGKLLFYSARTLSRKRVLSAQLTAALQSAAAQTPGNREESGGQAPVAFQ